MNRLAALLFGSLLLVNGSARAQEPAPAPPAPPPTEEPPPSSPEDEVFGAPSDGGSVPATPEREGGAAGDSDDDMFGGDEPPSTAGVFDNIREDPLALGGQLYLRLAATIADRGSFGSQTLSMPNLLDLYLDARPEERVRGFVSGRLSYDPTVGADSTDLLGQARESTRVLLDQLWIKTDIARRVFLTIGQERIKWGPSRLWNPNDFLNARRRDPLTLFDERTGVPMLKVHVPYETFNFYVIALFGDADRLDEPGVGFRFEGALGSTELALSGVYGKGRKTAFGLDISTALGPFDVTAEVSLSDETDTLEYSGEFNLETLEEPTATKRGKWMPRVSAGFQYAFKPNDDDVMYLGLEYFWNSFGQTDKDLYPYLLWQGELEFFYIGQHYLGLVWLVPQPGNWQDTSFTLSAIGNLSDTSFITRLDISQTIHTRLRLEAYVQGQYGTRGGEFRPGIDLPGFSIPAPALLLGLNLRLAI